MSISTPLVDKMIGNAYLTVKEVQDNLDVIRYVASNIESLLGGPIGSDFADDTAAAAGGVAVGQLYHTSGAVKVRLS